MTHKKDYYGVSRKILTICSRNAVEIITVSEPTVRRRIKNKDCYLLLLSIIMSFEAFVYSVITEFESAYGFTFTNL